ncbi:hypothetical protein Tco_0121511 [Tanacetum coccineum]
MIKPSQPISLEITTPSLAYTTIQQLGENVTQAATEEPPSHTEGETDDMETQETKENKAGKEQEPERPTRAVLISTVRPLMRTYPELEMMTSHAIFKLTDATLEFPTS